MHGRVDARMELWYASVYSLPRQGTHIIWQQLQLGKSNNRIPSDEVIAREKKINRHRAPFIMCFSHCSVMVRLQMLAFELRLTSANRFRYFYRSETIIIGTTSSPHHDVIMSCSILFFSVIVFVVMKYDNVFWIIWDAFFFSIVWRKASTKYDPKQMKKHECMRRIYTVHRQ